MLQPTEVLRRISKTYGAPMTYFVDAGYLWRMEADVVDHPELAAEQLAVYQQLKNLLAEGNEIALHIHPHWEDSYYQKGKGWVMNTKRYKLADFSETEIDSIFFRYKNALESVTGQTISVFRAGGWCLQPFDKVKSAFEKYGIKVDSTVFNNGYNSNETYYYDFRNSPDKDCYRFSDDLVKENANGDFTEYPIASEVLHPIFFWCLFIWGRLLPNRHKGFGDGFPVAVKGFRKKVLFNKSLNCVSLDGYFAKRLPKVLKKKVKKGDKHMVVIGHPKACTLYSLERLESFVKSASKQHNFTTFQKLSD